MNSINNASETSHPSANLIQRIFGWHPRFPAANAAGILIASLLFLSPETSAQETYIQSFLKLEGIQGDSTVVGHKDEIELLGFTSGIEVLLDGGGGSRGSTSKPVFPQVNVFKSIDQTSPLLFVTCAKGKSLKMATLTVAKVSSSGTVDFLKIVLSPVFITKVAASGDSGSESPLTEHVALDFTKIEWTVTTIGADGRPKITRGHWDRDSNTGGSQ